MSQTNADATAKITSAMFSRLLAKLTEKGILDRVDVEQILAEATKVSQEDAKPLVFDEHGEEYVSAFSGV
ncbi:hypothetical protein [Methylobacterium sp. JK268]